METVKLQYEIPLGLINKDSTIVPKVIGPGDATFQQAFGDATITYGIIPIAELEDAISGFSLEQNPFYNAGPRAAIPDLIALSEHYVSDFKTAKDYLVMQATLGYASTASAQLAGFEDSIEFGFARIGQALRNTGPSANLHEMNLYASNTISLFRLVNSICKPTLGSQPDARLDSVSVRRIGSRNLVNVPLAFVDEVVGVSASDYAPRTRLSKIMRGYIGSA